MISYFDLFKLLTDRPKYDDHHTESVYTATTKIGFVQ